MASGCVNNRCIVPPFLSDVLKPALLVFVLLIGVSAIGGLSAALAAEHTERNVTGDWAVDIEHKRRRCRWQGQIRLDQDGAQLTGTGEAAAPPAQRLCPRLKGDVEGSVNGQKVKFGFATGRLGTGAFDGALAPGGRILNGTWSAGSAAGTWRAERLD
jgi:hypothetical protein